MVASTTTTKPALQAPPEAPRKSNFWKRAAAFVACQLLAILFVEFVLFLAGLGEEEIFKFDPDTGFRHMANKRITWRTEGFAQSYLNSDGMREPGLTVEKPANTYRVALLGDSMVEGFQVPIEQTFGALIGKQLSPLDGKQVQVLNFGTSGYSTAQEYLQLKRQVLKYKPDLVLLCYNSRDLFENWSPPDQVITNVRPAAIHLPGGKLFIDTLPVRRWFKSPRAKFMQDIDWVRQHSRIYGLFAAIDLEWSQKNIWYKAFINSLARPRTIVQEFQQAMAAEQKKGPAFQINFFEDTGKTKLASATTITAKPVAAEQTAHVFISATPNAALSAMKQEAVLEDTTYTRVVTGTLQSLFSEMRAATEAQGGRFAVISLPVRAQLCPIAGMETKFGNIDYAQELSAVKKIAAQLGIPYFDVQAQAENLPQERREGLFYVVHLSPDGQKYIAAQIQQFVGRCLSGNAPTK